MMNKKILIGILIFALASIGWQYQSKSSLRERFQEFKQEFQQKKNQGYDVSEAENLIGQAKQAKQEGDIKEARRLLEEAFKALEKAEKIAILKKSEVSIIPEAVKEEAKKRLSMIKVASQYRYVTDRMSQRRGLDDVIRIFKETKTDFIFQGWITQWLCPEKSSDLPSKRLQQKSELNGYSYEHLRNAIFKIKKEMLNVIFCGGTQAEFLYPDDALGKTEQERRDKAWVMALDPSKWNINFSKKDMQGYWARRWGIIKKGEECPGEEELKKRMRYYFPDLTNPDFQKVFLNRIYKQIDAGVDAIWIDMLYAQANLLKMITKVDENHPAVQESHKAASKIVDCIHEYGLKKGKYIYVITWVVVERGGSIILLHPQPNVDIAMTSPEPDEILDKNSGRIGQFDEEEWDEIIKTIKEKVKIPLFARIDYGGIGRSPLRIFSQELTSEQQREFLRIADKFFSDKGINFIYPIHGGDMGSQKEVGTLSYSRFNWYDALAPEFDTYETIKELAKSKK